VSRESRKESKSRESRASKWRGPSVIRPQKFRFRLATRTYTVTGSRSCGRRRYASRRQPQCSATTPSRSCSDATLKKSSLCRQSHRRMQPTLNRRHDPGKQLPALMSGRTKPNPVPTTSEPQTLLTPSLQSVLGDTKPELFKAAARMAASVTRLRQPHRRQHHLTNRSPLLIEESRQIQPLNWPSCLQDPR
jgi:hypothetical protein